MNLQTLRKKALNDALEVEDILTAANARLPGLAPELTRLSSECGWSLHNIRPDGTTQVPFAKWAEIASAYAAGEYDALMKVAENIDSLPFVLGLLEKIKSSDALTFLLRAYANLIQEPSCSVDSSLQIASTLNVMLSFKPSASATSVQANTIQEFLFALCPLTNLENQRATVILALRGVGDEKAIEFVSGVSEFHNPWADVKKVTLRSIKNRLQKNVRELDR